jgi:hypothetical protein
MQAVRTDKHPLLLLAAPVFLRAGKLLCSAHHSAAPSSINH